MDRQALITWLFLFAILVLDQSLALTDDWILQKFDEMTRREADQDSIITTLQSQLVLQDKTIRKLTEGQQQQETKYLNMHTELELQVKDLQQQLVASQRESRRQATKFEKRVSGLERKVDDIQHKADVAKQKQSTLESKVNQLQQQLLGSQREVKAPAQHHPLFLTTSSRKGLKVSGKNADISGTMENEIFNSASNVSENISDLHLRRRIIADGIVEQDDIVAFHAVIDKDELPTRNDDVVNFERVLLNFGSDYHGSHGLFTASKGGLYMFSVSLTRAIGVNGYRTEAALMKNYNILGTVLGSAGGVRDQGAITVVTQLHSGDEVWVKTICCNTEAYFGERMSSFTGVLLFEL